MPRDLPGLYWDEEKNRYFPLASRPVSQNQPGPSTLNALDNAASHKKTKGARHAPQPTNTTSSVSSPPRKRRRVEHLSSGFAKLSGDHSRLSATHSQMRSLFHKTMTHSIASLSEGRPFWHGDHVFSSLDVSVKPDGSFVASTGDRGGWLQTYNTDRRGYTYGGSRELFLGSEVMAVCRSDKHRLAVSFGPSSKIAIESIEEDAEIWNIISIGDHRCHDVRAAHLLGHSLVLGAAKRGILLPDIQAGWSFDVLPTDSDVLAVYQLENVIYTGSRNGSIHRFDRRLSSRQKGQELFRNRFTRDTRSITHISVINEAQMLVSTVKGDLELLDLRFARIAEPVMSFDGHVNSYTTNLGITTSPCSSYIFAAGQDQRIRAWSLLTGELISPPPQPQQSSNGDCVSLFQHALEGSISAIQVTEGGGGGGASANGMTLWAASGKKVYRFWLGQRLGDAALKY